MSYSVFIERAVDGSPAGLRAAAEGIGKRFGVPTEALVQRLAQGRFRVKANIDLEKAKHFAQELVRLGAEASISDADGGQVEFAGGQAPATAAAKPDAPKAAEPAPAKRSPTDEYQTGLSAAFSAEAEQQDLGALGGAEDSSAGLRLASLDGEDGGTVEADERAPSAVAAPTSVAEGAFLPPELADEAKDLELLTPLPGPSPFAAPQNPASEPAPTAPTAPATPTAPVSASHSQPAASQPHDEVPEKDPPLWLVTLAENTQARMVFAAAISILMGFALAHVVATMREDTAYANIAQDVTTLQSKVTSAEDWKKLDAVRASALDRMRATRRSIAISSVAIMAVVAVLMAFLIVRKLPWERYESRPRAQT